MGYVSLEGLPRTPRWTPYQAVKYALGEVNRPDKSYYRMCDHFCAWTYGYAGSGYYSADAHWEATPDRFKHRGTPPAGALVYWETSGSYDHIAIAVNSRGHVASNDIKRLGKIDVVPISYITSYWGARYLGWTNPYFLNSWGTNPNTPPPLPLPAVDLSRIQNNARGPVHSNYPDGVLIVQRALRKEGLLDAFIKGNYGEATRDAYAAWQRTLGFSGADANGIPGPMTLRRLGDKYGFRVVD